MITRWRAVTGKNPAKRDLAGWDEDHWITFLRFCLLFIVTEEKKQKIAVTEKSWREIEAELLSDPNDSRNEFLFRVNQFTFNKDASFRKFYAKLSSIIMFTLGYLRANPSLVSTKMRNIIEPNPRLNWCLSQTKVVETAVGEVVAPENTQDIGVYGTARTQTLPSVEKRLLDANIKLTDLFTKLIESIDAREFKKLTTKEKLAAVTQLRSVLAMNRGIKINAGVFKNININASSRQDLENALLDMSKN